MADSGILFKNFALLDVESGTVKNGHQVLVRDGRIAAVEHGAINAKGALEIDLGGRTLMPGLIDLHVHFNLSMDFGRPAMEASRWGYMAVMGAAADHKSMAR